MKFFIFIFCVVLSVDSAHAQRSMSDVSAGSRLIVDGVVDAFQTTFGLSREGTTKELSKIIVVLGAFAIIDVFRGYPFIKLLRDAGGLAKDAAFIAVLMQMLERLGKGKVTKRDKKQNKSRISPFLRTVIACKVFSELNGFDNGGPGGVVLPLELSEIN